MPPTHYKIKRKELKQPDEFVTFVGSVRDFLADNWRQLLISAGIVLAGCLIVIATFAYERSRDRAAGERFSNALAALNSRQYKAAEEQFLKLAADEPNRRVGRLARFYAGTAYLALNELPHARDSFIAFIANEHDPAFNSLARLDLGVVYERIGDLDKAIGAYKQAAMAGGLEQPDAELGAARVLAKQGHPDAAIAAYREFLIAHPYARERDEVTESLAMLGASPLEASEAPKPAASAQPSPAAH